MAVESYQLKVLDVIRETTDVCSVVLEVPLEVRQTFSFRPGQFLTVAVPGESEGIVARCYSLSGSPLDDTRLTFTVKRTEQGYASNWICDRLRPGHTLQVLPPNGIFTPASLEVDLLLFAAGSGVTPIMSIARHALAAGTAQVVVFCVNRDERSIIFADEWENLIAQYPDRLQVLHWLTAVQGRPTQEKLAAFAGQYFASDTFVCGPEEFMKVTVAALEDLGFPRDRFRQEKFVSLRGNPFAATPESPETGVAAGDGLSEGSETDLRRPLAELEIELNGEVHNFPDWTPECTLLQFLESKGVKAPYSCREGECGACAVRVLEGEVAMIRNDVLEEDELADGLRLGCQSLPTTDRVRATYS
ncbi:ferredoxin--NADP reductase [Arthrobacter sp. HMWF013]|uniref:ferredoxin--NADP reductase n=1 Tax=Arthrobacter sp. HMWF013 TaxID=2056849 RepID=UPI000D3BA838|nr:ferredoxin--NADP reductase [Arthrobacter sp. HMWF013]PTT68757.1 3-ketosteroid-9-alpha-hydroxylase [Arthrobacter sp. HMWF013]